jgi:hypothetical protein
MELFEDQQKHTIPKFPERTKINQDGTLKEPRAVFPNVIPPKPAPVKISLGEGKGLVR